MARIVAEGPARDGAVPESVSRRVPRITLSGYIAAVLLITQWPAPPDPAAAGWLTGALDALHAIGLPRSVDLTVVEALANVAMFVPLGLLLPAATRLRPWAAIPVGAAFSTLIELSQLLFLPNRFATVQDVVVNTLGAAIGAAVVLALRARRVNTADHTDGCSSPDPAASIHGHGRPTREDRLA